MFEPSISLGAGRDRRMVSIEVATYSVSWTVQFVDDDARTWTFNWAWRLRPFCGAAPKSQQNRVYSPCPRQWLPLGRSSAASSIQRRSEHASAFQVALLYLRPGLRVARLTAKIRAYIPPRYTSAPAAATVVIFPVLPMRRRWSLSYTNSPIGLNFLIAGYSHQSGSVLVDPSLPISNVKATVDGEHHPSRGLLLGLQSGNFVLVVPYGSLSASGDVFEQSKSVDRCDSVMPSYASPSTSLELGTLSEAVSQLPSRHHRRRDLGGDRAHRAVHRVETGEHRHAPLVLYAGARCVQGGEDRMDLRNVGRRYFLHRQRRVYGDNVRHQDPLFSVQAHAIYNFNRKMWAALDGTPAAEHR